MTENAQNGAGGASNGDQQAAIAEYAKQRQNLKALLAKRKQHDRQLSQLEQNIVELEAKYLANTRYGNIVKGFDNYIKGTSAAAQRKQGELKEEDYIWSRSSLSHNALHPDNIEAASTASTPGAPTPVSTSFANSKDKDSGSNQPTPTSATEKASGKSGKPSKKRTLSKKEKDADVEDSETDTRETKKVRTNFGLARK